jgi:hypothetical protein
MVELIVMEVVGIVDQFETVVEPMTTVEKNYITCSFGLKASAEGRIFDSTIT